MGGGEREGGREEGEEVEETEGRLVLYVGIN